MKTATRTIESPRFPPLTLADRGCCCGAQAFVRVVLPAGQDLLMCVHHFRQHQERLRTLGATFVDGSGAVNAAPSPAAF